MLLHSPGAQLIANCSYGQIIVGACIFCAILATCAYVAYGHFFLRKTDESLPDVEERQHLEPQQAHQQQQQEQSQQAEWDHHHHQQQMQWQLQSQPPLAKKFSMADSGNKDLFLAIKKNDVQVNLREAITDITISQRLLCFRRWGRCRP